MLKNIFLIFFCFLTFSVAMAQKAPPKSTTMALLNDPNFDSAMYDSGPLGAVLTTVIMTCAGVEDAVNYSCYYGKKLFSSDKGQRGASGSWAPTATGTSGLPAWATPSATPTALSDIETGRRRPKATATAVGGKSASGSARVATADTAAECEWDMTRPPRIIKAPGCSTAGKCLCQGRVICGNKSRIAVCSETFCKDGAATACAKQLRYSSKVVN